MNLRNNINRKVTYTKVTITSSFDEINYIVYGETTERKELKKWFKENEEIPTIKIEVLTEQRTMTIDQFIKNSILIKSEVI